MTKPEFKLPRAWAWGFSCFLVFASVAGAEPGPGAEIVSSFRQANALYGQGKYREAADRYEEILKSGWESSALYYNLGNANFKQGNLGRAILNYRRAWNLSPGDPEINKNLAYAQENLQDDLAALPLPFLGRLRLLVVRQLPLGAWFTLGSAVFLVAAFWVLVALVIAPLRKIFAPVLQALLALLILVLIGTILAFSYYRTPRAIILKPAVGVRYGPQEKDAIAFELHEGTEVKMIRSQPGWLQIALPDGMSGWLSSSALEII